MKKLSLFVLCTLLSCPGLIFSMRRAGAELKAIRLIRPAKLVGAIRCASGLPKDEIYQAVRKLSHKEAFDLQRAESILINALKAGTKLKQSSQESNNAFNELCSDQNEKLINRLIQSYELTKQGLEEQAYAQAEATLIPLDAFTRARELNRFRLTNKDWEIIDGCFKLDTH